MKVYDIWSDPNKKWARFDIAEGQNLPLTHEEAKSFFESQPRIRIDSDPKNMALSASTKIADFSSLGHHPIPMFSDRAKRILDPYIGECGQWLRLDHTTVHYWLFHITNVIDALDETRSEVLRFDDGSVMRIARFVFRPDCLSDELIFAVPQRPLAHNLVTDRFVKLVEEHRLSGFNFKLLWADERESQPA